MLPQYTTDGLTDEQRETLEMELANEFEAELANVPFAISNPDECNRYGHWNGFSAD